MASNQSGRLAYAVSLQDHGRKECARFPFGKLEPINVMDIKDGSDFNVIAAPRERSPEMSSFLVDREAEEHLRSKVKGASKTGS